MHVLRRFGPLAAGLSLVAGCSTVGPRSITGDRFNYNEAGAQSSKEQILLNIVRLTHGKPLHFVEIASMLSQYSLDVELAYSLQTNNLHGIYGPALRATYPARGDDVIDPRRLTNLIANVQYTDTPTISYSELSGEAFANRVMAPIAPDTLIHLAAAGWGLDRLLACCVQQINGISNRMIYCDDEAISPEATKFEALANVLHRLQESGSMRFAEEIDNGVARPICYIADTSATAADETRELREMLGYPARGRLRLRVTNSPIRIAPDELAIETRSVLATMYALSRESIESQRSADGAALWLRVRRSAAPQADAHVQVCDDGSWYYIPKTDWTSKRTFALLSYLFSLQSAESSGQASPLVTIPAAR